MLKRLQEEHPELDKKGQIEVLALGVRVSVMVVLDFDGKK